MQHLKMMCDRDISILRQSIFHHVRSNIIYPIFKGLHRMIHQNWLYLKISNFFIFFQFVLMLKSLSLSMSIITLRGKPNKSSDIYISKIRVINSCMFILFAWSGKFVPAVHATWATSRVSTETPQLRRLAKTI